VARAAKLGVVGLALAAAGTAAGVALLRDEPKQGASAPRTPPAVVSSQDQVALTPIAQVAPVATFVPDAPAPAAKKGPAALRQRPFKEAPRGAGLIRCDRLGDFVVSRDGKRLFAKNGESVRIFDLDARKLLVTIENPREANGRWGSFCAMALSPEEKELLTWDATGRLRTWDARTGEPIAKSDEHPDVMSPDVLAFTSGGAALLTGGLGGTVKVWSRDAKELLHDLGEPTDGASCVALSPDGKLLATCAMGPRPGPELRLHGHIIRLFDTTTWKEVRAIDTTKEVVKEDGGRSVDMTHNVGVFLFTQDGSRLYSLGAGTLRAWEVATGKELHPELSVGGGTAATFTKDERTIAIGRGDGAVVLVDVATFKIRATVPAHRNAVLGVAALPDGATFVTGSQDGTIRFFDAVTGEPLAKAQGHLTTVTAVVFSRDGRTLASASKDRTICLRDAQTGRLLRQIERPVAASLLRFTADGHRLLVDGTRHADGRTAKEAVFTQLDASSGEAVATVEAEPRHEILRDAQGNKFGEAWVCWCHSTKELSADGRRVVFHGSNTRQPHVLELGADLALSPVATVSSQGFTHPLVALSPSGDRVAMARSAEMDWKVRIVDVATDRLLREIVAPEGDLRASITALRFSPDGRLIAVEDCYPLVRIFDAKTGELRRTFEKLERAVFSPDGKLLAGVGPETNERGKPLEPVLKVMSIETGAVVGEAKIAEMLTAFSFAEDGKAIAAGDGHGAVVVFELP
ncbi:MAG: WD40 repeat domain-containing protein, partial [Planctomycetota bacterium]